jgi:hypothetical protein
MNGWCRLAINECTVVDFEIGHPVNLNTDRCVGSIWMTPGSSSSVRPALGVETYRQLDSV